MPKQQIKSQESELGITYKKNLTDENTKLSFNKNQLKGLDDGKSNHFTLLLFVYFKCMLISVSCIKIYLLVIHQVTK